MSTFNISTQEKDPAKFALAIQQLFAGRSDAAGTVTLAPGATSTVVTARNCAPGSKVFLFATTANAAAALATTYASAVGTKAFTLAHANNAQVDRTFFFVCIG